MGLRRAIARRTALDDVRDVNVLTPQPHRLDHVIEQLAGAADERFALRVFVRPWAFTHEHQFSAGIANPENNLLAPLLVQFAAGAVAEIFANQFERSDRIGYPLPRV